MTLNLEDIAQLAGVSRSTVSRVINQHPNVSARTREKVLQVIRDQNFHPNPVARMLVTQRTQLIGIVVSQTATTFFNDQSAYFPTVIQGIADVANHQNYGTLLWLGSHDNESSQGPLYRRIIHNRLTDGVVVISASNSHQLLSRLVETSLPFVAIERPREFADRVTYVTIDNVGAAKTAVQHLIGLGRRKIGTLAGPAENSDGSERLAGYRAAMQEAGLPIHPDWIVIGDFTVEHGYIGMQRLLKQGVEAVVTGSDQIAIGALQALQAAGACVPDDVAVVGFDDLPAAVNVTPQLTTVHHPIREKGTYATRLLLDILENHIREPQQILLPTHLVIRQSCGALNVPTTVSVQ